MLSQAQVRNASWVLMMGKPSLLGPPAHQSSHQPIRCHLLHPFATTLYCFPNLNPNPTYQVQYHGITLGHVVTMWLLVFVQVSNSNPELMLRRSLSYVQLDCVKKYRGLLSDASPADQVASLLCMHHSLTATPTCDHGPDPFLEQTAIGDLKGEHHFKVVQAEGSSRL